MKTKLSILFLLFGMLYSNAQDIDLYKKDKNDNYNIPSIDKDMSYEEFELLAEHMRMKDMMYAVAVPGYIHFKAKENKTAYWLLGTRLASFITIGGVYLSAKSKSEAVKLKDLLIDNGDTHTDFLYGAIALALATYGYDLIHGDYILHKKQESIRYKYALKASKNPISFNQKNNLYPSLSFSIQF